MRTQVLGNATTLFSISSSYEIFAFLVTTYNNKLFEMFGKSWRGVFTNPRTGYGFRPLFSGYIVSRQSVPNRVYNLVRVCPYYKQRIACSPKHGQGLEPSLTKTQIMVDYPQWKVPLSPENTLQHCTHSLILLIHSFCCAQKPELKN